MIVSSHGSLSGNGARSKNKRVVVQLKVNVNIQRSGLRPQFLADVSLGKTFDVQPSKFKPERTTVMYKSN
jgi:hypothetical protein